MERKNKEEKGKMFFFFLWQKQNPMHNYHMDDFFFFLKKIISFSEDPRIQNQEPYHEKHLGFYVDSPIPLLFA